MGGLNVSFEVKYDPSDVIEKDGVRFVDAGENNSLTGMCIVSVPACPDANALDMVAEAVNAEETTGTNEVNEEVPKEEKTVIAEEVQAETEAETKEAIAEETKAEVVEASEETATAETAEAEVVHEEVEVRESFSKDPYDGTTYHEVKTEHTVVETVEEEPAADPAQVIADCGGRKEDMGECGDPRDARIAELEAELARVNAELQVFKDAKMAAELKVKQDKAKSFAEKQGLDVEDENVAKAIAEVNYEMIAELAMAETAKDAEEHKNAMEITMASFVDMEIHSDEYGGLLKRPVR